MTVFQIAQPATGGPQWGVVTLSGPFWSGHRDEIVNLIRNEEKRAMAANPLVRLIDISPEGESLFIRPLRRNPTINLDLNAACLMRTGRKARMRPRTN